MQTKLTQQIRGNIKLLVIREATGEKFTNSQDIYDFMKPEARIDRECAWVIHLNGQNRIVDKELVSMGTVSASFLQPREVFRSAIINGSAQIIVVHNHPSGNTNASIEDLSISHQLKKASQILGVPLLDFIIIGDGYNSFADDHKGGFEGGE